jgi:4-hydroxy-3-methylbut-2-enyl diphosphate reductase
MFGEDHPGTAARMRGAGAIRITAGASAPEILVHEVIEKLRCLGRFEVLLLPGEEEDWEFRLPAELVDA